eukprot:11598595-Ditylum_brightwellii.AAC.1
MSSFVGLCGGTKRIGGVCRSFPHSASACGNTINGGDALSQKTVDVAIRHADNSSNGVLDGQPVKHG